MDQVFVILPRWGTLRGEGMQKVLDPIAMTLLRMFETPGCATGACIFCDDEAALPAGASAGSGSSAKTGRRSPSHVGPASYAPAVQVATPDGTARARHPLSRVTRGIVTF